MAELIEYNLEDVDVAILAVRVALAKGMNWDDLSRMVKDEKKAGNPVASLIDKLHLERNCMTLLLANNPDEMDDDKKTLPVDKGLRSCVNLKWLSVLENKLETLEGIQGLTKLTVLDERDRSRILSPYKKILQWIENTRNVKLDIRTKLCLRDSLYLLAKSAEQRHNDSIANGCTGDDQACKSMVPHNGSRCMRFMDMETDINPIDRSIAHLLFHRPHDQLMSHLYDTIPFKSSATTKNLSESSSPSGNGWRIYRGTKSVDGIKAGARIDVPARALDSLRGWIVRSHIGWGGKRSMPYKGVDTSL
ncbi:hypothetical protein Ahy_B06g083483 [Arachis hypogaea]|uniref:Uncharacterized protein n=1 Tax=Arachis hypogaea TaxID=3818 RepID=A0A444YQ03_ARAHY|nr:hypothetical protein Ahy_B06g083483 [Arachis hypogaea]